MKRLLAIIFACGIAHAAHAHNITLVKEGTAEHPAIILIKGMLEMDGHMDNVAEFSAVAAKEGRAIVFFDSPGGSVMTAITIGRMIRKNHFVTAVADAATCTSACAFAWLAGIERLIGSNAKIGFHAPHNNKTKEPSPPNDSRSVAVTASSYAKVRPDWR